MFWITIIIIAIILFMLAKRKHDSKDPFNMNHLNGKRNFNEANDIALKVKTLKQYFALEEKVEKTEESAAYAQSEKKQKNLDDKVELLQLALKIAYINLSYSQYYSDLELETSLTELNLLNKKITNDEKLSLESNSEIQAQGWMLITPDDEFEQLDSDEEEMHKFLIKLQKIITSDLTEELKETRINTLVEKNSTIASNWFDSDSKPYSQLINALQRD